MTTLAAVDLGAASGRVMLGRVGPGTLELVEVARFANEPVRVAGALHWDILALYREILAGLRGAGTIESIGIDSWGVDYGLIDDRGALVGNPVHYRDARTDGVMEAVLRRVGAAELYGATGIQFLPFNTVFQLASDAAVPAAARTLLLIPDLIAYWLTGEIGIERTNASTTALLDPTTGDWSPVALGAAGIGRGLLPPLREPGTSIGPLRTDVAAEVGSGRTPVTAVATHDTGSAVVAVPAQTDRFAYISCGTWSLVGVELPGPVLTEAGRAANFTNEVGVDGTIRYLRNVMGLWPLQECLRAWGPVDLPELLAAAADVPAFAALVDLDDPIFLPPGDMPGRIAAECARGGVKPPTTPPEFARCILDSLALAHRRAVADAVRLTGRSVDVVHIVGGGARNALLCQLTADACGVPVVAGPEEATAIGNVLIQARALGTGPGSLSELRELVARTQPVRHFRPR
jgi:rhamnulokinase